MNRFLAIALVILCTFHAPVFASVGPVKEWTWMVYLNADNNLDMFGRADLKEMSKVGSSEFLNIVVLIDHHGGPASLTYLEKNQYVVLKDMGNVDMGDYRNLVSFTSNTIRDFPAKHYALVIWNHGNGWYKSGENVMRGISYDESSGNHITTGELGIAMRMIRDFLGRKIDILAMDACLMQMMEVAFVVKDDCEFLIASEEIEPTLGYPYIDILQGLKKETTPVELARHIVAVFRASYDNGSQGKYFSTLSALDCSKLGALKEAIDGFANASLAGDFVPEFASALKLVQKFYFPSHIDLAHLVELLKSTVSDPALRTAAEKLEKALGALIIANGNTGAPKKNAKGLAIYFPATPSEYDPAYEDLGFAENSLWDEMVRKHLKGKLFEEVSTGDLSGLEDALSRTGPERAGFNRDLITDLNFRLNTESFIPMPGKEKVEEIIRASRSMGLAFQRLHSHPSRVRIEP